MATPTPPGTLPAPNPFYRSVLQRELDAGTIGQADRVLVACGGNLDRVALLDAGFRDVLITNLAPHGGHEDYAPFQWEHQDVESLGFDAGSFDLAIVHSGLHHCYNPYRALGELCRVARKAVIAFEPYETWFTRLGARIGYGQQYEDLAVHSSGGTGGGVANTEIPNFVYRFSEAEVRKFARALLPQGVAPLRYYRALRINQRRFQTHRNPAVRLPFKAAFPLLRALAHVIPSLNNNLAFVIEIPAPAHYHPWIEDVDGRPRVNRACLEKKYGMLPPAR